MSLSEWMYIIIGSYLIIMGVTAINLKVIWITITFKVKVFDFADLYGEGAARIIFIILGILILVFKFVIMKGFTGILV